MDNTREELLKLIAEADDVDIICFLAITYVIAPDSPPTRLKPPVAN